MQVKTLIQPSAAIVRVTEVAPGNVYKRLDKPSYGDERLVFGVVTDVMNNGEQAVIVALEFVPVGYSTTFTATIRTFNGDGEVALFPATPDEFKVALREAADVQYRAVSAAQADADTKKAVLDRMTAALTSTLIAAPREAVTA